MVSAAWLGSDGGSSLPGILLTAGLRRYFIFAIVLAVGFALSFVLYHKFRMRVPGVVATPLLAVYTIHTTLVLPIIVGISLIVFAILQIFYRRSFIYGRRLFLLGCIFSIVLSVPALLYANATDVVILTILPGIFAYNTVIDVEHRYFSLGLMAADLAVLIGLGLLLTRFSY